MRGKLILACVLLILVAAVGGQAGPASAAGGDIAEANAMAASVAKVAPAAGSPRLALALDAGAGALKGRSSNNTTTISIPSNPSGQVTLQSTLSGSTRTLRVTLPEVFGSKGAVLANDGTVVFAGSSGSTGIAIQAFDQGVRIHVLLRSALANSEYAYPVDLPIGGTIQILANGGLLVVAADNSLIGVFAPPWAKDSDGVSVPTRYEVRGNRIVQIVEHTYGQFKYPVVADPYFGLMLIDHATWVYHSPDGWTFEVTPTAWARINAGSLLAGWAGWDELYARYSCCGLNTNLNGMRDQYICHQQIVAVTNPGKATWNIDEWRPDVGYLQTVNSSCNPGGPRWFD